MKRLIASQFNPATLFVYIILMMVAEIIQLNTSTWWDPLVALIFNLLFYLAFGWTICLAAAISGKMWGKVLHFFFHSAMVAYSASSLFLALNFHRHWDAFTMQFLHETSPKEAGEFLTTYLSRWENVALILCFTLLLLAEWWLNKHTAPRLLFPKNKLGKAGLVCLLATIGSHILFFQTDANRNYDMAANFHSPIKRNALWNLWQSCLQYQTFKKEFERCAETQKAYREKPTCAETEADLVLIIGESFNKHMSNLYDGPYNTNPLLKARITENAVSEKNKQAKAGKLFIFKDVIASDNGTTQNFKYLLSTASVADKDKGIAWCDRPLFPTILRHCGFNVIFYSNQFAPNDNLGQWDASMGFVSHPAIEPYIFNHRNKRKFPYDLALINDYAEQRHALERQKQNLCIFHLYGQHVNFNERYPETFKRFGPRDVSKNYLMRPNQTNQLDDNQRSEVATYLNATAYNDSVVDRIIRLFDKRKAIIIYLSDHGEEIHNFRRQYGRTDLTHDVPEAKRCQLDVPFLVYLTPRYLSAHPNITPRLTSALSRKFMTDDLPQFIFDLLGVKSQYFIPQRSPINEKYLPPKRRKLQNGTYYDPR